MAISNKEFGHELFQELKLNQQGQYFVAFSGGVDSTALLHLMREQQKVHGFKLTALHVNHQLQDESNSWADHCAAVCESLGVPLHKVALELKSGAEVEARNARYQWFSEQVPRGGVLLTAHHQQDRAETFLFNLMRGAGSTGLSSLRAKRPFHGAQLIRPLLRFSQAQILDYAAEQELSWIEDPSNQNTAYSRNEIRHEVLPQLESFRSDAVQNIARAAANLEQENGLLREIAICDLVEVREHAIHPIDQSHALCVADIAHLSSARQANLLRFWLGSLKLHTPSRKFLAQLLFAISSPPASTAVLQEGGRQFRFYKGFMYVMPAVEHEHDFCEVKWQNLEQSVELFENKLRLGSTAKLRDLVGSRDTATLRLAAKPTLVNPKALQGHSLNLKKWMQDIGVPPWRRQALPLLTMSHADSDVVLAPVDQYLDNDWVSFDLAV